MLQSVVPSFVLIVLNLGYSECNTEGQYKRVLHMDKHCLTKIRGPHYLTQYEKYLMTLDGEGLLICMSVFEARNEANVDTDYNVCFRMSQQNNVTDCNVKLKYYNTVQDGVGPSVVYTCNDVVPREWCSNTNVGKVYLFTQENTNTTFTIEVVAYAGINLSKVACAGIGIAALATIVFISVMIAWTVRKRKKDDEDRAQTSGVASSIPKEDNQELVERR